MLITEGTSRRRHEHSVPSQNCAHTSNELNCDSLGQGLTVQTVHPSPHPPPDTVRDRKENEAGRYERERCVWGKNLKPSPQCQATPLNFNSPVVHSLNSDRGILKVLVVKCNLAVEQGISVQWRKI